MNRITTLKDLAACNKLSELYLRKNKIEDVDQIAYLKHLPSLRILWISDNPFDKTHECRATIIKALPRLVKLDNQGELGNGSEGVGGDCWSQRCEPHGKTPLSDRQP